MHFICKLKYLPVHWWNNYWGNQDKMWPTKDYCLYKSAISWKDSKHFRCTCKTAWLQVSQQRTQIPANAINNVTNEISQYFITLMVKIITFISFSCVFTYVYLYAHEICLITQECHHHRTLFYTHVCQHMRTLTQVDVSVNAEALRRLSVWMDNGYYAAFLLCPAKAVFLSCPVALYQIPQKQEV